MSFIDRLRHTRPVEVDIAALEAEYKGITPVDLIRADYRILQGDEEKACANLCRSVIEVSKVPAIAKAKDEKIEAKLVYKENGQPPVVADLENPQQADEIAPGRTLRFLISEKDQKKVFNQNGEAVIYVKGRENKWVLNFSVQRSVPDKLMRS
jgi:hypothetical protein